MADERFPGYDVMRERETWDPVTEAVIMARVTPPAVRFFAHDEAESARALVNLLAGADEDCEVPVLELIADRLEYRRSDGFRFQDMPPDHEAWRASVRGLDTDAMERAGCSFAGLDRDEQVRLIEAVRTWEGTWHGLPARRTFSLWMRYVCGAFYSFREEAGLSWTYQTALIALGLVDGGVFDAVPDLVVVHPHLGGVLPYVSERISPLPGSRAKHRLEDYLRTNFYVDTAAGNPGALRLAIETYGIERVVFATDYPFYPMRSVRSWVENAVGPLAARRIYDNRIPGLRLPAPASRA